LGTFITDSIDNDCVNLKSYFNYNNCYINYDDLTKKLYKIRGKIENLNAHIHRYPGAVNVYKTIETLNGMLDFICSMITFKKIIFDPDTV